MDTAQGMGTGRSMDAAVAPKGMHQMARHGTGPGTPDIAFVAIKTGKPAISLGLAHDQWAIQGGEV